MRRKEGRSLPPQIRKLQCGTAADEAAAEVRTDFRTIIEMAYLPPGPQLAAFLFVAGLLTITPGADMALVMRHALSGGTRPAFFASLGIAVGCLILGAASALGVSVVFARSAFAFAVLKYVGGAYLVNLGVRAFRHVVHRRGRPSGRPCEGGPESAPLRSQPPVR